MKRLPHVAMLLVAVALVAADKGERPAKPPIPAAKELEKAEVKVRDVFDIDAAISIEANAKLARKMLATALDTADDPASQYVMLRMVRDMSARNGDYAAAERAIGEMSQRFAVDVIAMRSEAVVQALVAKKVSEEIRKRIVRDALRVVRECHKADRYKHATKNIAAALKAATRLRDRQLLIDTRRLRDDGKVLAKQYESVRGAFETLKTKPDDPAANTSAGKYVCYVKGDWKRGLAMLAQGNDALLKDLATREQRGANKHEEQIVIADAWWKIADEQPSHTSGEVRQHAQSFYRRALPQLTGLAKVKVKRRLTEIAERGAAVYLDDVNEVSYEGRSLGKRGVTKVSKPCKFRGKILTHAIVLIPKSRSAANVVYNLEGRFNSLVTGVGIFDGARINPVSPLTFKVYGDGKLLWKSRPMQRRNVGQDCKISVRGVQKLMLVVDCPGSNECAWTVWIEPAISK